MTLMQFHIHFLVWYVCIPKRVQYTWLCGGPWLTQVSSSTTFHLPFRDRISVGTWSSSTQPVWLLREFHRSSCLYLPRAGATRIQPYLAHCMGSGVQNSGPETCTSSLLPTEPSLQPSSFYIEKNQYDFSRYSSFKVFFNHNLRW